MKAARVQWSIDAKIAMVDGEDCADLFPLSDANDGRIGQVHPTITVAMHQLTHPRHISHIERNDKEGLGQQELPQGILRQVGECEEVHRLSDDRPDRQQRRVETFQRFPTYSVELIAAIKECHERTGVNEHGVFSDGHGRSLGGSVVSAEQGRPVPQRTQGGL